MAFHNPDPSSAIARLRSLVERLLLLAILTIGLQSGWAWADVIKLATTTSTENSGLLAELLPHFTRETGYKVHVIAVGTGKALRMGVNGDVDVVLVHARKAEERFIADGNGVRRHPVMYNDFVLVGPENDPVDVGSARKATEALARIQSGKAVFVSRGDDSGTHKKERDLWKKAGLTPKGAWYREVGQGMGKVLQITDEMQGYTLTDRGTWLAYQDKFSLSLLFQGDPRLLNPYGIIRVSDQKYPDLNHRGAEALIRWITAPVGQNHIANFHKNGEPLFVPSAGAAAKH